MRLSIQLSQVKELQGDKGVAGVQTILLCTFVLMSDFLDTRPYLNEVIKEVFDERSE